MSAWYTAKLREFVNENTESIAGMLSKSGAETFKKTFNLFNSNRSLNHRPN